MKSEIQSISGWVINSDSTFKCLDCDKVFAISEYSSKDFYICPNCGVIKNEAYINECIYNKK